MIRVLTGQLVPRLRPSNNELARWSAAQISIFRRVLPATRATPTTTRGGLAGRAAGGGRGAASIRAPAPEAPPFIETRTAYVDVMSPTPRAPFLFFYFEVIWIFSGVKKFMSSRDVFRWSFDWSDFFFSGVFGLVLLSFGYVAIRKLTVSLRKFSFLKQFSVFFFLNTEKFTIHPNNIIYLDR